MKWLAPLIILVILVIFGAWFCSTHPEPPPPSKPAANANADKANTGGNMNSPANTNMAPNTNAADNRPANANASRY